MSIELFKLISTQKVLEPTLNKVQNSTTWALIKKLLILSSFPGDLAIGVHQSKRQSSTSQRDLQIETKIGEFWQTPRSRGFSNPVLFLA